MTSDTNNSSKMVLRLCTTCEGIGFVDGKKAVEAALDDVGLKKNVKIKRVACLGACETPRALAMQSEGRASYVFSDLDLEKNAKDIAQTCQVYLSVPKGWIEDAHPCGRLRYCLRARIPALEA